MPGRSLDSLHVEAWQARSVRAALGRWMVYIYDGVACLSSQHILYLILHLSYCYVPWDLEC